MIGEGLSVSSLVIINLNYTLGTSDHGHSGALFISSWGSFLQKPTGPHKPQGNDQGVELYSIIRAFSSLALI